MKLTAIYDPENPKREGETGKVWARDNLALGRIDDTDDYTPNLATQKPRNSRGMSGASYRAGSDE